MGDVVMVATMVAFVLLCVGYVGWCDRILSNDDATGGRGVGDTAGDDSDTPAGRTAEVVS